MIPETDNFPQSILQSFCNPIFEKFDSPESEKEMPAVVKFKAFAIESWHYSYENINLLRSLKKNQTKYKNNIL